MTTEPEIDALGRWARIALRALRWLSILVGVTVIAAAVYTVIDPVPVYSDNIPPLQTVMAHQVTALCLGLPLVLPVSFTIGRGWRVAVAVGALLWFGPMLLTGDHGFGFVMRMFASLVAIAALAVWRTLYGLSNPVRASS